MLIAECKDNAYLYREETPMNKVLKFSLCFNVFQTLFYLCRIHMSSGCLLSLKKLQVLEGPLWCHKEQATLQENDNNPVQVWAPPSKTTLFLSLFKHV